LLLLAQFLQLRYRQLGFCLSVFLWSLKKKEPGAASKAKNMPDVDATIAAFLGSDSGIAPSPPTTLRRGEYHGTGKQRKVAKVL